MSSSLTNALISNATQLLALSIVYELCYIFHIRIKKSAGLLNGILIGLIGIAIMSFPFELIPGVYYDTRSILLSVSALIFGFYPASIAAAITIAYRFYLGGVGLIPGITLIIASVVIGLLFRKFVNLENKKYRLLKLYIFGLVVHAVMVLISFLISWDTAIALVRQITLPIMVIYPVGVVLLSLLILHQIERDKAIAQLAEAEARYKSMFYNNHAIMFLTDPTDGSIVDANPAAAAFYGWSESELKTMNLIQIADATSEEIKNESDQALDNRRNYFVSKDRKANGSPVDVEVYTGPIYIGGKTLLHAIVHDISERTEAVTALQESENRFRQLVDNAPDAIFVMIDKKFAFVNKAGLTLLGAESEDQLLGTPGYTVLHPDQHKDADHYMKQLRVGMVATTPIERVYIRLDKTLVSVDVTAVPITFGGMNGDLIFARDITERKLHQEKEQEMEAQLRQQQKLEAIGTLAGGVAHEINNPLNGIMNYAQLIMDASEKDSTNDTYSREIIHETERISVIVKNLLQFSRQEKQSHSYASIYDIINQTISLVNTIIKKDQIKLDIQLDESLPDIKCRSQQIQQVIMNLLTNARDASNEKYPDYDENKVIRLKCSKYQSEGRRWIRLTVQDYGVGIPPELKDRILEPFFSTKPKETGTGLGLSISYGIVGEHHGKMTFESVVGKYTKFILELPVDNGWSL